MRHTVRHNKSTHLAKYTQKKNTLHTAFKPWGFHLVIDAVKCDLVAIKSKSTIAAFVKYLVKEIDMKAYGPPRIVRFGDGNKMGYTLVQLIETSNITAHFSEETGNAYLDVFSCKSFHPDTALNCIKKYFSPSHMKTRFFKR